jgi:hypothetical protein
MVGHLPCARRCVARTLAAAEAWGTRAVNTTDATRLAQEARR